MPVDPAVVLVRPSEEGNIGAVARAMANTGLGRLILVEPAAEIGTKARGRAVGAEHILESAERSPTVEQALAPFRRVVGTSSQRARVPKTIWIEPRQLPQEISSSGTETALVFGPERTGLTLEELSLCDPIVRIPTASKQPTLNLAQAVLILAYEIYLAKSDDRPITAASGPADGPATVQDVAELHAHVDAVLQEIGFARDLTYPGVLRDLRQLASRAHLSEREVQLLHGICRRVENKIRRPNA